MKINQLLKSEFLQLEGINAYNNIFNDLILKKKVRSSFLELTF